MSDLSDEAPRHARAFEAYFALGPKRSLTKVAAKLGVSRTTVKRWSKRYEWPVRVEERDRDIARVAADKSIQIGIESSVRNAQIVQMALVQAARQIAEGKVRCTIADLDRLIRLEAFLEGRADSRQEIIARDLAGKSTTELHVMLRRELEVLQDLTDEAGPTLALDRPAQDLGGSTPSAPEVEDG